MKAINTLNGIVVFLLTALTLSDQLIARMGSPLKARANYHLSALPPSVARLMTGAAYRDAQFRDSLNALLARDGTLAGISYQLTDINGYWTFQIENGGSERLSNVRLSVPRSTEASVKREDGATRDTLVTGVVVIGDLLPGEAVSARVWVDTFLYPRGDSLRIAHDRGLGWMVVMQPTGRFGQFAEFFRRFVLPPLAYLLLLSWLAFQLGKYLENRAYLRVQKANQTGRSPEKDGE